MHRHPTDKYELEPKYKPSREQMDRYNKNVRQKYQENPEFRERTLQRNRRWKANLMEEHIEKGLKNRKEYFTEYNTAYYRTVQLVDFVNRSEEEKRRPSPSTAAFEEAPSLQGCQGIESQSCGVSEDSRFARRPS
jgi:hypothetical protein